MINYDFINLVIFYIIFYDYFLNKYEYKNKTIKQSFEFSYNKSLNILRHLLSKNYVSIGQVDDYIINSLNLLYNDYDISNINMGVRYILYKNNSKFVQLSDLSDRYKKYLLNSFKI